MFQSAAKVSASLKGENSVQQGQRFGREMIKMLRDVQLSCNLEEY